jgi:outer membrane protein TolC
MRYSLEGNQNIEVASYSPKQSLEDLTREEAVFDPSLFFTSKHGRNLEINSLVPNTALGNQTVVQSGVAKYLATGGTLSAYMQMNRLEGADQTDGNPDYIAAPTFELKQPLLKNLGGKAEQAAIEIANHNVNISEAEFRKTVTNVVTEVAQAYWLLYMYKQMEQIDQGSLAMAREVHRRELVRLEEGMSKPLDVERARGTVEARRADLVRSKKRVRVATDQLKLLLNWSNLTIDSNTEIVPLEQPETQALSIDATDAIKEALENRPELEKAREHLDISEIRKDLARHEQLPKLDAFMRYSLYREEDEFSSSIGSYNFDSNNNWAVGIELEWPIGNRAAKSIYEKHSLEQRQANSEVQRMANRIKREVRQAIHAIVLAKDEIEATRLEKEAAENVVKGEYARFELGQVDNQYLLRAQDLLAAARGSNIRAIVDYNIALAELTRAQGLLPPGLNYEGVK